MTYLEQEKESTKQWAAETFGIPKEDIVWYNSGTCYDRIGVLTEESAKKVQEAVKGERVNGGMLHGMPLGSYHYCVKEDGTHYYDVYC